MQVVDPLLVTYVYKGLSYEAISKLSSFVTILRENQEVWEELVKTTKTQKSLLKRIETQLIEKINSVFKQIE